ncbi:MAG TPA: vitamin B12 dependent-methionine synthase activation domain-containing protein [bacterium]|nr:vitamin B12 dependent-methionine synthase activation domain-containing protein [bacterium]
MTRAKFDLAVKAALVWKHLRMPAREAAPELRGDFDDAYRRARAVLEPRYSYARAAAVAARGRTLELEGGVVFESGDLVKLAAGASAVVAIAATVGDGVDELAREYDGRGDTFAMTVADAVGSVAAEELISLVHGSIKDEAARAGEAVTRRISPGYGDFELAAQERLLRLAGGFELGISLTENYMMIPRKSVTAVAAVVAK